MAMIEIRNPKITEVEQMKQIWEICFGDKREYIDFYYEKGYKPKNTLVGIDPKFDKVVAMVTLLPVLMYTEANIYKGDYLYAVAVLPEYRKQGIMRQMEEEAVKLSKGRGSKFITLVPAEDYLFPVYEKLGYHTNCYVGYQKFSIAKYTKEHTVTNLSEISPDYFLMLRQMYLNSLKCMIQFDGNAQSYLYEEMEQTGGKVLAIQNKFGHGYIAYYFEDQKLFIKEAGLNYACFCAALKDIGERLNVKQVFVRAQMDWTEEMDVRPYGMIKFLDENMRLNPKQKPYMNMMLD